MPPKCKFTREEIINAALDITREQGISAVTARAVGAKLNSSSKVIFSLFQNMEEVQQAILSAANALYEAYLREDMSKGEYPSYKASGMAYIRFAKEERELFRLLFMRDRSSEKIKDNRDNLRPLLDILKESLDLTEDEAYRFHMEMWIYVHGIATMTATSYLEWDTEFISSVLTDGYNGLKYRYTGEGEIRQ